MLAELRQQNPIIEKTFNEASEVLGYDMWELIQQGAQEDINLTQRTQPILLTQYCYLAFMGRKAWRGTQSNGRA